MAKFTMHEEVLYNHRRRYIVGIRQPGRYETGQYYDLASRPNSPRIDHFNVHESDIKPVPTIAHYREEITQYSGAGWAGVARHNTLELVKSE